MNACKAADRLFARFYNLKIRRDKKGFTLIVEDPKIWGKKIEFDTAQTIHELSERHGTEHEELDMPEITTAYLPAPKGKKPAPTTMRCPHCKGSKRIKYASGMGECGLCNATGNVPTVYHFRFVDASTGRAFSASLNAYRLDIKLRARQNTSFPEKIDKDWSVPLSDLFQEACAFLGVTEETHEMHINKRLLDFGMYFYDAFASSNRAGHDPDPHINSIRADARYALIRSFSWVASNEITVRFEKRPSCDEMLAELDRILLPRGMGYALINYEGSIATGEHGWLVWTLQDDKLLSELGCAYTFSTALYHALIKLRDSPQL